MKLSDALAPNRGPYGFVVSFEIRKRGLLEGDHFPDVRRGEGPIASEEEAWQLADKFAANYAQAVNIHVCESHHFVPVPGYQKRQIRPYPPGSAR